MWCKESVVLFKYDKWSKEGDEWVMAVKREVSKLMFTQFFTHIAF